METILELAQEVARHLDGWTVKPRYGFRDEVLTDRADLVRANGWKLYLAGGGGGSFHTRDPRRIEISGQCPHEHFGSDPGLHITAAKKRGAEIIAKEITRRLLPDYEQYFTDLQAAFLEQERDRFAELDALNLVVEASHGHIHKHQQDWLKARNYRRHRGQASVHFGRLSCYDWPRGQVENFCRGRLDLKLEELTPQEAATLLETLIALRKPGPTGT